MGRFPAMQRLRSSATQIVFAFYLSPAKECAIPNFVPQKTLTSHLIFLSIIPASWIEL